MKVLALLVQILGSAYLVYLFLSPGFFERIYEADVHCPVYQGITTQTLADSGVVKSSQREIKVRCELETLGVPNRDFTTFEKGTKDFNDLKEAREGDVFLCKARVRETHLPFTPSFWDVVSVTNLEQCRLSKVGSAWKD